tara:strand:+ start:615 stop:1196 length:582 start_codon:yes stop_codon:yes gene_type:complete
MLANRVIGILALQGDFIEHEFVLKQIGVKTKQIRLPKDLEEIDSLIIPGGESTTLVYLMDLYHLDKLIAEKVLSGMPVWGTCAGLIVLSKKIKEEFPVPLNLLDIEVSRNAYGRQVDSFEQEIIFDVIGSKPFNTVFIRAPKIISIGNTVESLGELNKDTPVAVREKNILGTSFHPELTSDFRFHNYFIQNVM